MEEKTPHGGDQGLGRGGFGVADGTAKSNVKETPLKTCSSSRKYQKPKAPNVEKQFYVGDNNFITCLVFFKNYSYTEI